MENKHAEWLLPGAHDDCDDFIIARHMQEKLADKLEKRESKEMSIFTGNFSMELKHPIDEKTWDIIADAEFDKTKRIFFKTKSGKEVAFIKEDVLDKIKAEIEEGAKIIHYVNMEKAKALYWCLEVIDKYAGESEDEK